MKIVLNSYTGIGTWLLTLLEAEGHVPFYHYIGKRDKGDACLAGLVPEPMYGEIVYSKYDLSLFDLTGKPREAERSLSLTPTLGDSMLASRLEEDRLFGIEIMEQSGIEVPPYEVFDTIDAARRFVTKTKKRYVFKPYGGQDQSSTTTYVSHNFEDLLEYLDNLDEQTHGASFILQEFVENGCEISTESYFNGEDFYLVNATLEEKKFMNDGLGPATGCAGNLVWCYATPPKVFTEGLAKLGEFLREQNYRGMCDLNTICTTDKVYGLEWTPRFGYDASFTLFSLLPRGSVGDFLYGIASGERVDHIQPYTGRYAASVRTSIPPYPLEELKIGLQQIGVPLGGLTPDDLSRFWLWDAALVEDRLVTCGQAYGVIGAPIYQGDTCGEAFALVYERLKKLKIPNLQYRTDLGGVINKRLTHIESLGWLRP